MNLGWKSWVRLRRGLRQGHNAVKALTFWPLRTSFFLDCSDVMGSLAALKRYSVLLVDDHALFRAGMHFILADGGVSQVLQAGSLTEALSLPDSADVVLLDVQMPGINGVEGLTLLKRRWPKAAMLMLSAQEDLETQQLCLRRGALAFVSKTASPEQIRHIVHQAACGQLAAPLLQAEGDMQVSPAANTSSLDHSLSARQLDVLVLMCEGISNKAIARKLFVSENTVRSHVAAVLKHFGSSTRTEAVMAAQKSGMVSVRPAAAAAVALAVAS